MSTRVHAQGVYLQASLCILTHLMGCGCCVECRCVTVCAMQRSAGGVYNNLKFYMLHFEHAACVLLY